MICINRLQLDTLFNSSLSKAIYILCHLGVLDPISSIRQAYPSPELQINCVVFKPNSSLYFHTYLFSAYSIFLLRHAIIFMKYHDVRHPPSCNR